MNLAPIVLFTFNRLEHTQKTIEALKKNILADQSELYIFSDGARSNDEKVKVEEVRKYLKSIEGFKRIKIIEAENNIGLASSVIMGVSDVINKYEKIIVLEDDLVTSKYFLTYMNECLNTFQERRDIWSISGYSPSLKIDYKYEEEIYLIKRGNSWGWGTWKDRWESIDWNITEYRDFKKNKELITAFNECGKDLAPMLEDQMCNRIDSWAIRWVYNQFRQDRYTVYPIKSFVKNIGNDMSGTHTTTTTQFNVILREDYKSINRDIKYDSKIGIVFKEFYDKNFSGYLALVLKKIGLYRITKKIRNYFFKKWIG